MPLLNGVMLPDFPIITAGYGLKTPFGILLPPGGMVAAYVRSTGFQDGDDPAIAGNLCADVNSALARVRSGLGDTVVCLPGHTESVTSATAWSNLKAGTKVVGVGQGSAMPTFTFNNTAAQLVLNKADVTIQGLRFQYDGVNTVVLAISVTGADNAIVDCDHRISQTAKSPTTCIQLGSGGDRFLFAGNNVRGLDSVVAGDFLLNSAVVTDFRIINNVMIAPCTAASGLVRVAAVASLNCFIAYNHIANTAAASTACVAFGAAASTGMVNDNRFSTLNNGTASSQGLTMGAGCLIRPNQNFSTDQPVLSGILNPLPAT